MRALPIWLSLITLSAAPLLMAPPGQGCSVCQNRYRAGDATTRVTLGRDSTARYKLPVDEDGHHYVNVVVSAGTAQLDIVALDDGVDDESMRCDRAAAFLSCDFVGEADSAVVVTIRTTTSAAQVSLTSNLTPRAGTAQ